MPCSVSSLVDLDVPVVVSCVTVCYSVPRSAWLCFLFHLCACCLSFIHQTVCPLSYALTCLNHICDWQFGLCFILCVDCIAPISHSHSNPTGNKATDQISFVPTPTPSTLPPSSTTHRHVRIRIAFPKAAPAREQEPQKDQPTSGASTINSKEQRHKLSTTTLTEQEAAIWPPRLSAGYKPRHESSNALSGTGCTKATRERSSLCQTP